MAFKLYELTASYQQILDLITDSEVDHPGFADTLESIEDAIEDKLNSTAIIYKTLMAQAKAIKEEEDRLKKRRQSLENNAERIKTYAEDALLSTGKQKVEGANYTLRMQNNPPSVFISDEKAIPAHYLIEQDPKIDKKAIADDLKNEIDVEGALLQRTRSIRIV